MRRLFLPLLAFGLTIAGCVRTVRIIYSAYTDPFPIRIIGKMPVEYYIALRDTSENKMYYSFCSVTIRVPFEKLRYSAHYKTRIENHVTNEHFGDSPIRLVLVDPDFVTKKYKDRVPFTRFTGSILSHYYNYSMFGGTMMVRDWIAQAMQQMHMD